MKQKKLPLVAPGMYDGGIRVTSAWNYLIPKFKPMDLFFTQSDDIFGKGIRIVSKNFSPDRECEFNHTGIFTGDGACTLECQSRLESFNFFEAHENKEVLIARLIGLSDFKARKAIYDCRKHIGQLYPVHRIPLHFFNLAHIIHHEMLVCSEYVAKLLFYVGARNHRYYGTTPDHLVDEVTHNLNSDRTGPKYEILFRGNFPTNFYHYCKECLTYILMPLEETKCPFCDRTTELFKYSQMNIELDSEVKKFNHYKWSV